jgi:site-specific recombinase XerD
MSWPICSPSNRRSWRDVSSLGISPKYNFRVNYQGEPISERGIRKLVVKYRKEAGITKKASCHTLRHTFATYKAEKGVSPFQLQQWLGHANLNTTQIYVHLGKQNAKKIMQDTTL